MRFIDSFSKRLAMLAGIIAALIVFAAPLPASANWYIGADGVFAGVSYANGVAHVAPTALYGVNGYAGYDILPNVAIELGGEWLNGSKSALSASIWGITADGVLRVPLSSVDANQIATFNLLLTGGITWLNGDLSSGHFATGNGEFGVRAGGGIEVALTDYLAWRNLVRLQRTGFGGLSESEVVVSSGLTLKL